MILPSRVITNLLSWLLKKRKKKRALASSRQAFTGFSIASGQVYNKDILLIIINAQRNIICYKA